MREVQEETGLNVRETKLIGVYTSPHVIVEYADGNLIQGVTMSFEVEVEVVGGELRLSDETTAFAHFTIDELDPIDVLEQHSQRIKNAVQNREAALIR